MNIDGLTEAEKNKLLKQELSEYLRNTKIISKSYTGEIKLHVSQGTVAKLHIGIDI